MSEQKERALFKAITVNNISQAIQRVDEEGYPSNRKSSTYDLVYKETTYPPKYIMSLAGYFADNNFINHNEFSGGEQSVCFEILRGFGFTISPKSETKNFKTSKDSPNIHLKYTFKAVGNELDIIKFKSCFEDYIAYCKRSQWLTYREGYKFKFARWLYSRVDFEKQNDEQILQICRDSQSQVYTDESNEKGINFITSALKYGDSFISIQDISVLRKIYEGELLEDGAFKNSPLTFPKFSCWAGTLIPSEYKIYSSEELTSGIAYLFNLETYPKSGVSSFNLANTCLSIIADAVIDNYKEEVNDLIHLIFPDSEDVLDCDLSWLIQDFGLYLNRIFFAKDVSYYWVNQGSQYKNELDNGCIVAPIGSIHHHKRLCSLIEGDIIIHYAGGAIQATSVVTKEFVHKQSPYATPYANNNEDCFVVEVDYTPLDKTISIDVLKEKFIGNQDVLPKKYSPFTSNLSIVQSYCLDFNKESYDMIFNGTKNRNYWLYAPGEGGRMWEQFYDEGIMALGWDDLGDLNEYDSKDDVVSKLQEINNTTGSKKNDATANDDFKNRMNVGDIVIVKKGLYTLLGYGEVSSDYYFDNSQENYKSRRNVNWKTKGSWNTGDQNLVVKTLTDITSYKLDHPEYKYYYEKLLGFMKNGNLKTNMNQSSKTPLNTILYGPPGTGKTFKLKEKYFDMFTISESSLSKEQFILNIVADLTWWQTFAIALLDLGRSSVNQLLEHEIVKAKASLSNAKNIRPIAWSRMQAHTVPECPNVNVADSSEPSIFYKESNSEWHVITEKVEGLYPEGIKVLEKLKDFKPNDNISIKNFEFVTFHQSFGYEDFIEGIKPKLEEGNSTLEYEIKDGIFKKLCQRAIQDPQNKYAVFIDEINRGNVSAIFGELITLIEDDKRIGNPQELRLKLPYSKTEFGLPSNLFIIGTMNTADRSVEALDTALRRRFSFQEVMPDPKLLMGIYYDGFNLEQVLTIINNRIEALLDRDHTIGHSYFMGLNSGDTNGLLAVFENKIIPLLQEYFYQDYEKLALVLGSGFVKIKNVQNVKFANFKGLEEPEIVPQFDLIDEIEDIELAVKQLLNIE